MKKIILILSLFMSLQTFAQPIHSMNYWETEFLNGWQAEYDLYYPLSNSNDSWQWYSLAWAVNANQTMFEATNETKYLDRALLYINNVIDSAKLSSTFSASQFQDSYLGWVSKSSPDTTENGKEYPLFETFLWRYVTSLLRNMKANNCVYNDPTYRAQYDSILAFTEKNIYEKWTSSARGGANTNVYRVNAHMTSHWARMCLNLFLITGKQVYFNVFDNFNNHLPNYQMNDSSQASMRKQIRQNPANSSAYWWNANWGDTSLPGQDVPHGTAVIGFMVEAHDLGYEWNTADINGLINLYTKVVWPAENTCSFYVDGSGIWDGWFNDGWMTLGRYDTVLQKRLEAHVAGNGQITGTNSNTNQTYDGCQFYANLALNAKILSSVVIPCSPLSLIQPFTNKFKILLYPNPASDIVTLNLNNGLNADLTLNIYNVIGVLVKNEILKQNKRQINIGDLSNGIYLVEIKSKNFSEKQKLIIQR